MTVTDQVILVENVNKSFRVIHGWRGVLGLGDLKPALVGINLEVHRGEVIGLLGPNGAGKTTLIRILCGLVLADTGRAVVNGFDVREHGLEARRTIGFVYGDERSFYWRLTLHENLAFFATLYGVPKAVARNRIGELLERLGLTGVAHRRMYTFSSGMKQRAAIARGLLHDPDLIVMDEPSRSLDPVGAAELHHIVRNGVADGRRTVLIATNVMSEAEVLCDRLALINQGRLVLDGTLDDFRAHLDGGDVAYELLVGGSGNWRLGLQFLPGIAAVSVEDVNADMAQLRLRLDPTSGALDGVLRHLASCGARVLACTQNDLRLEEIFRVLVRGDGSEEMPQIQAVAQ